MQIIEVAADHGSIAGARYDPCTAGTKPADPATLAVAGEIAARIRRHRARLTCLRGIKPVAARERPRADDGPGHSCGGWPQASPPCDAPVEDLASFAEAFLDADAEPDSEDVEVEVDDFAGQGVPASWASSPVSWCSNPPVVIGLGRGP